jgi:hypothetical protein
VTDLRNIKAITGEERVRQHWLLIGDHVFAGIIGVRKMCPKIKGLETKR